MAASKTKLRARADALREKLLHPDQHPTLFDADHADGDPPRCADPDLYASDAAPIADKLALLVVQLDDPEQRAQELLESNSSGTLTVSESWAAHAEYAALTRLTTKRQVAKTLIDPYSGPAIVVAALHGKDSTTAVDAATLVEEIKRQAGEIAKGDAEAIRALMSVQALVSHQTGLWTIHDAVNAISTEARATTRKIGVSMLNTSQRMLERLSRLDEAKPSQVWNVAQNQQVVQNPPPKSNKVGLKRNGRTPRMVDSSAPAGVRPALAPPRTVEGEQRTAVPSW